MARKRDIKPGFFKNEELGEVEPLARLLFAGLWCWADKAGRFEDRPKKLKADILPYDNCDGEQLMQQLADHGFVLRYEVDGVRYGQIVNWEKHQCPHPKEADSEIPSPYVETKQVESNELVICETGDDNLFATENTLQNNDEQLTSNLPASDEQRTRIPIPSFPSIPSLKESLTRVGAGAREDESEIYSDVCDAIQKIRPMANETDRGIIIEMIDHFPRDWILNAIRLSIDQKGRTYKHVQMFLNNWKKHGYKNADKPWEVENHDRYSRHGNKGRDRPYAGMPGSRPSQTDWRNEPDHL